MSPTILVLVSTGSFLIGWDVYSYLKYGVSETISARMYQLAKSYPIAPFILGIIFGHLFWSQS